MEEFTVYAIESQVDKRLYVGFTKNLKNRIKEHNTGKTRSTKGYRPWKLVFWQNFNNKKKQENKKNISNLVQEKKSLKN